MVRQELRLHLLMIAAAALGLLAILGQGGDINPAPSVDFTLQAPVCQLPPWAAAPPAGFTIETTSCGVPMK